MSVSLHQCSIFNDSSICHRNYIIYQLTVLLNNTHAHTHTHTHTHTVCGMGVNVATDNVQLQWLSFSWSNDEVISYQNVFCQ